MTIHQSQSRTPHGVRGLKFLVSFVVLSGLKSHPTRGAWIEIQGRWIVMPPEYVAPHTGCVD